MPQYRDQQGREVVEHYTIIWPKGAEFVGTIDGFAYLRDGELRKVVSTMADAVAYVEEHLPRAQYRIERHYRRGYGSTHHLTTKAGSQVSIYNEVDGFGRGHSHVLAGVRDGRSQWILRNVSAKGVIPAVRAAEAQGWTHITVSMEAF